MHSESTLLINIQLVHWGKPAGFSLRRQTSPFSNIGNSRLCIFTQNTSDAPKTNIIELTFTGVKFWHQHLHSLSCLALHVRFDSLHCPFQATYISQLQHNESWNYNWNTLTIVSDFSGCIQQRNSAQLMQILHLSIRQTMRYIAHITTWRIL